MAENRTDESPQVDWDVEANHVTEVDAERQRLIAERAARREARIAALAPEPEPVPVPAPVPATTPRYAVASTPSPDSAAAPTRAQAVARRTTDRFAGSLGLFLLRLVTAAIVGAHGLFHLLDLGATTRQIQETVLPSPNSLAVVLGAGEIAIAIALVFGLLTRVAGLGLVLLGGAALAFVHWGNWSPFVPGRAGFAGELELLLVAVGVLFLLVGGGGWAIDHGFRARRQASRDF